MTGTHPYANLPDYRFWRKAISGIEPHRVDLVVNPRFKISPSQKVATAGSCFAQHIAKRLTELEFNYFVPEHGPDLELSVRAHRGYGMFSARYGNVYTVRQLLQLFLEAIGDRTPSELPWKRPDGRYIDPLRPNIEPAGFVSPEDVTSARAEHLDFVRATFLQADVFIFTLGLTEAWRARRSGDVFPLAPGVVGGDYGTGDYEFINFTADEVAADLSTFLKGLKFVNPGVKVLLTVSPVPLIATAEDRHVLVSTVLSKSVLRVAADAAQNAFPWVDYFPSFEVITGNFNFGRYYEEDLREINSAGVDHAMRLFLTHYAGRANGASDSKSDATSRVFSASLSKVICDEESIAAVTF